MSDSHPAVPNRQTPFSEAFKQFIGRDWAPYADALPAELAAAGPARKRRAAISRLFPNERIVIPAGGLKVRSNDTDFRFRPHSAFAHLTGLGSDAEPDSVLVLEPTDHDHAATMYFTPRTPRDAEQFYADPRYGGMWVGARPSLAEMSARCAISCADISELPEQLGKNSDTIALRVLADGVDTALAEIIAGVRRGSDAEQPGRAAERDRELATAVSELRLTKDTFEVEQLRTACAQTATAFAAVVADLPEAVRRGRGERWVEGVFGLHARHVGNTVGYDTIAAAGQHACTLHWIRNDGDLVEGDLLLLDAGVELDTLYTADVTRTLPISGAFTDVQRRVYEAVLEAQEAGIAAARPGAAFLDVHRAAIAVIARHLYAWGLLPVSVEESLSPEGGQHRRWMVHGTSHHLGLDVHDCAQARRENYRDGTLTPGMVITVEPGLYFAADDELVPAELRGIGVRIEDDIVITESGNENLSAALPRTSTEMEAWMAAIRGAAASRTPA